MKTNNLAFISMVFILSSFGYNDIPVYTGHYPNHIGNNRRNTNARYTQRIGDKFIHHYKSH